MLQRSVTEIRRLPSGRPKVSCSARSDMGRFAGRTTGGIDPYLAPVAAQLLLPDGDAALDLLDGVAARLERLGSVRCRRDDRDARLAGADHAQAVPEREPAAGPARRRLRHAAAELPLDHLLVGRILDPGHALLLASVAHGPLQG